MTGSMNQPLDLVAAQRGAAVSCAANLPVDMSDPECAWFVESGAVDVFLVERHDGIEQSAPQHVLRAGTGRLLPGVAPQIDETSLGLIAKGLPGTVLRCLPFSGLGTVRGADLAMQVDAWISDISTMLARDIAHYPRMDALLKSGEETMTGRVAARHGTVWVTGLTVGAGLFMDLVDPVESGIGADDSADALPLTAATWLTVTQGMQLATASSSELAEQGLLLSAVGAFNRIALGLERLNRRLAVVDQANLARTKAQSRREDEEHARGRLLDVLGSAETVTEQQDSGLHDALRMIGKHESIEFQRPESPLAPGQSTTEAAITRVLHASAVRGRKVRLAPQDRWWVGSSGAMLAFRSEDGRPVALLPSAIGNYREIDPADGRKRRIAAANAASLQSEAWSFYPSLPTAAGWRDLWSVARMGLGPDLARFVVTGLLGSLIMLLPALALGPIADEVIPDGDTGLLYGISLALVVFGLAHALVRILHGMALMRMEGRAASRMEAAFWDRLLRLPTGVLRRYPANALAVRGMTFRNVRDTTHDVIGNAMVAILFLSPVFVLIAWRDVRLGALTAGFGLLSLLVTVALGLRQIRPHDRRLKAVQRLSGRLFQLINGIPRLRVDGAESSGFAAWAWGYREQKRAELELSAFDTHLRAFSAALPTLAAAMVILVVTLGGTGSMTTGDFIVIFVLFLLYQRSVTRLGDSFSALAAVVPATNQVRALLGETTETRAEGELVDELHGEVVFDKVSFRHDADGPLILDEVSIRALKGEFVAIVGESGAGKSTVLRLALGLERPSSGSIYFDGRDLQQLNLTQVRRQIGAVSQTVQLHPQDLWDNIVADLAGATADDAWRAAGLAVVDREIAAMPMGMLTPVGAGAALTSGGESQRIQIARALVRKPRILLLDEATSWLDAETQAKILDNLSRLTMTRIVVAHRLSTLRQADRIYVMRAGRVVQEGSFEELSETPGVFQELTSRQLA